MTTKAQARNARFQRGSAAYICRCCKHNTRSTGGDGAGVGLCDICYELAGEENCVSDTGELYDPASVPGLMRTLDESRGPGTAQRLFPTVWEKAFPERAAVALVDVPSEGRTLVAQPANQRTPSDAGTIELAAPSWASILPILLAATENGTQEGRALAKAELVRMAQAADKWNAHIKNSK